ncbi:MAG: PTS glucose transporter subunit IIA [Actinomyces sp.]|nr:PTS glucose transporter subunit IIA [Actinomyces sp.]
MSFLVRAPFGAHVLPLAEVPDPVFASGVVGDGRVLLPEAEVTCVTVHSPINGVVTKLKSHAAIVTSTRGLSILIHLGIDTVGLRGRGFAPLVEEGDIVDAGTPLIHWDLGPVRGAGLSPCVPVIVVNPPGTPVSSALDQTATEVAVLEPLFSVDDN